MPGRHLECHGFQPLVLCQIRFDYICASCQTYRCYHRADKLSLYLVVGQVPSSGSLYAVASYVLLLGDFLVVIQDVL